VNRQFRFYLSSLLVAVLGFILTVSVSVFFTPNASLSQTPVADSSTELIHQGQASFEAGDFADAVESLRQAVEGYRTERQPLKQALALSYLALAYQELGKWDDARDAMNAGFSIIPQDEAGEATTDTVRRVRAQLLNSRGQQELALGQAEKALASWQEAQTLYTQIDYLQGAIGTQVNQGQALAALGKYRKSCNLVLQALSGSQVDCSALVSLNHSETSDTVRETASLEEVLAAIATQPSPLRIIGLQVLGNTLRVVGKLAESKALLDQSLMLAKTPQMKSAIALSLGNTLRALTDLDWRNNDEIQRDYTVVPLRCFKNKADKYTEAIATYEQAARSLFPLTRVQAQIALLEIQPDSIAKSPELLTELQQLPSSRASVYARVKYAQLLACKSQDSSDSFAVLNTALEQAREIRDFRAQSVVLGSLGQLYERQENWEQAKSYTKEALDLIPQIPAADYQSDLLYQWDWQLGRILLKEVGKPYAIEHPNIQKAIDAYTKAVASLKTLRQDLAALNTDIQYDFRDEVEPVYREAIELLLKLADRILQTGNLEENNQKLKLVLDITEELQIATLNNFFQNNCIQGEEIALDEEENPDDSNNKNAAIIYTLILSQGVDVIFKLPEISQLYHESYSISRSELDKTIDELRARLRKDSFSVEDKEKAKCLYRWIFKNIEPKIDPSRIKTLVFVLDDVLQNIPMSVLFDGEKYLIQKYSIVQTPGRNLFKSHQQNANPDILTAGISEPNLQMSALPYVKEELDTINNLYPNNKKTLLNEDFTQSQLREQLLNYPFTIVHLATHGQFTSQAKDTFIAAWQDRIELTELGSLLKTRNTMGSQPIDLLVLSACETAQGDRRAALGLAGVAVTIGHSSSTLATLWQVDDNELNVKFIRYFYQYLLDDKLNKSEALQRAQLMLLEEDPKPNNWATYVLIGNW
jgi:CHAT domain-containing protein